MIKVGIAGIGFMGMTHYLAYEKIRGASVRAICEKDRKRLAGDWRSIKGNFGPPGRKMDLTGIDAYAELDEMLANPKLDMIDVCLPPSLHADVTIAALKAGKHVFCEKPIALEAADGRRMVAAAERAGKMLMVGHVLPFFPEYTFAHKAVSGGKFGRLLGGHFKRMISDPLWLPDFYNPKTTGGPMLDLHVHDAHFIRLLFGMPNAVQSVGSMRGKVVERFNSQFRFDDSDLLVTASSGVIDQQGRPFMHAYEIYLEKATLLFEAGTVGGEPAGTPLTVLNNKGKAVRPKLPAVDPFVAELTEVVRSIAKGTVSPLLGGDLARDALTLCHKQTQSVVRGRAVKV
ncbi:MAG: Gfo/Idh/MocA family oxidoreductase [Thermoguttaceae bacterium]